MTYFLFACGALAYLVLVIFAFARLAIGMGIVTEEELSEIFERILRS